MRTAGTSRPGGPRPSFGFKLLVSYLVLVLVPICTLGWLAYVYFAASARDRTAESVARTLEQIRDNVTYRTDEIRLMSDAIFFNQTLQRALRSYRHGWTDLETLRQYTIPTFQDALLASRGKLVMRAYFANPMLPEIYEVSQDEGVNPVVGASRFELLQLGRIEDRDWYRGLPWADDPAVAPAVYRGEAYVWRQVEGDAEFRHLSLLRQLVDFDRQEAIGFLRVIVPLDYVLEAVQDGAAGEGSRLMVLDDRGHPMPDAAASAGAAADGASGGPESFLRIEERLPDLGWTIVAEVPRSYIERDADKLRSLTIAVSLASTALLSGIAWLVSRHFSRRVNKLLASLDAVRKGDFRKRIAYSGRDEFAQIADAFNKMSGEIDGLIQEVYVANLQKKEAELASLQSQINPHFLYNTLSTISRLAKFGETENVHRMLMELAKFYRLAVSGGDSLIGVHKELEQAMAYTAIQNIKYRDKVKVMYDVDANVYGHTTVKLILQPVVENAIEHAFCQRELNIRVRARLEDGRIVFAVIDDGMGMRPETMRRIFGDGPDRIGYGLRNVHERIRLQYGPEYGVAIGSRLGIGTTVRIAIPAVRE